MATSYRFHCRNQKCGASFHRYYPVEEFEKQQYGSGWACFRCGFPRMAVMKSNKAVKDTFQAGYQRNIGKYCRTYQEYKTELKKMGLIEIGYEDIDVDPASEDFTDYWDDEMLKEIYQDGISLDGELIKGLKNGSIKIE